MKFRLVEDFDDLLLEVRKPAIEPGSELEKNLIYDIEHTDTPYSELAKKYGLNTYTPIYKLIKHLNLDPIPRQSLAIEPGSQIEKNLIYDIENTDKTYRQLSKEYGISFQAVGRFAQSKNLRDKKEWSKQHHVYFNTLEAADIHNISIDTIWAKLKFHPSIYLGKYSINNIDGIYQYIREKYFNGSVTTTLLIEFYLKIASGDISLNAIIEEMKDHPTLHVVQHSSTFDYKFLTVSTDELSTVDFYSDSYSQLAKDILTFLHRNGSNSADFDSRYKDLKAVAVKLDSEIDDYNNQINTYIRNNLENIARNIYSNKGDMIEASNYINGIPYETSFNVDSLQDIARCIDRYKGYLLYGFMDKTGDIIYIGISVRADSRGGWYSEENRPLILKAFEDNLIKKLIIFKSNLPIQSRTVSTELIYALEAYFAEHLFKTYPENYPKALNQQKPGQNTSSLVSSKRAMNLDIYLSKQDKLLSPQEYRSAVRNIAKTTNNGRYPYRDYAKKYVSDHNNDLSLEDKKNLFAGLRGEFRELLWNLCSSETEYRSLISGHHTKEKLEQHMSDWRNYRIKNNLPITEDLDDDIDMEYYV